MTVALYILSLIALVALLLVASLRITRTDLTKYELTRRSKKGDTDSKAIIERETLLHNIVSLQRAVSALMLVVFVLLLIGGAGWLAGTVVAVVVALEYGAISRMSFIRNVAHSLYDPREKSLLTFASAHPRIFSLLRSVTFEGMPDNKIHSREELLYVIDRSTGLITEREKQLIEHGLQFTDRYVSELMTPVDDMTFVDAKELLGPLVLDDLHKTGHSRFPVIDKDPGSVIGILDIRHMLTVDAGRHSTTAEKAMDRSVSYIHEDQSLEQALAACLTTHHSLLIVIDRDAVTVGVIGLTDIIRTLLGRTAVDEYDIHDDPTVVSQR